MLQSYNRLRAYDRCEQSNHSIMFTARADIIKPLYAPVRLS